MKRPRLLVVVTGTGTEVGKTFVAAGLVDEMRRRSATVVARKPVQSFSPGQLTDADILARASGEPVDVVCPPHRAYPIPMAPPMAAEALGCPVPSVSDLTEELARSWPDGGIDLGLVEGAGGVASPLTSDGDTTSLVSALGADLVVVVSDPGLGVINLVRLSTLALGGTELLVHLNRFHQDEDLHRLNRRWLVERDGLEVTTSIEGLADVVAARLRR